MARFFGSIGYGHAVETSPGVFEDKITEREYYGDVNRSQKQYDGEAKVIQNLRLNNEISIVADSYAEENFFAIKYVRWMGARWVVTNVEVRRPRLILNLITSSSRRWARGTSTSSPRSPSSSPTRASCTNGVEPTRSSATMPIGCTHRATRSPSSAGIPTSRCSMPLRPCRCLPSRGTSWRTIFITTCSTSTKEYRWLS